MKDFRRDSFFFKRPRLAVVALVCVVFGSPAAVRAQLAPADAASPMAPPDTSRPPTDAAAAAVDTPAAKGADLSFDLFDDKPKDSAAQTQQQIQRALAVEHQARLRRRMLTAHQAFGFSTLAVFAATLIIGQLNYQDKYVSGDFTGRYELAHLALGTTTAVMFTTTGLLAMLAPTPYAKRYRLDTAMIHRVAMALATAGMVTQMVLGPIIDTHAGRLDQPQLALGHLVVGYASFAFMLTGTLAYVF